MLLFWLQSKRAIKEPDERRSGSDEEKSQVFSESAEVLDLVKLDKLLRKPDRELMS